MASSKRQPGSRSSARGTTSPNAPVQAPAKVRAKATVKTVKADSKAKRPAPTPKTPAPKTPAPKNSAAKKSQPGKAKITKSSGVSASKSVKPGRNTLPPGVDRNFRIRAAKPSDAAGMAALTRIVYPNWDDESALDERKYTMQIDAFQQGQYVALANGHLVGFASSLIVQLDDSSPWYNHEEMTGDSTFNTHDPAGDSLYGADLVVHPDWRNLGITSKLYHARKNLLKQYNLRQMVACGRLSNFEELEGRLTAKQYVAQVVAGKLVDTQLCAQIEAGYSVEGVHYVYLSEQQELGYATHLVMPNPTFEARKRMLAGAPMKNPVRHVRVCATQYDQRRITDFSEFADQIEYFADTAQTYDSHILVFPEFVTAQLFSTYPRGIALRDAVDKLADTADKIDALFKDIAKRYRLYIVGGTTPIKTERGLKNVAHFYTPAGDVYTQEKLHITPSEREHWGIEPGDGIKIFETPLGRFAIVICYDIEFPELCRLLVEAGVDVILNPFATDERKSYLRVRYCAQARAVENMVYVVMSGNVGGLTNSPSMYLNFGQAAICTPSDFAFPMNGIAAEGVVNQQTVVIADLDLGALEVQRVIASVRPLLDRRPDLYELKARVKIERVVTT